MAATKFASVDEYHGKLDKTERLVAETLRKLIKAAAPDAEEVISYNMPAFKLNGILVFYAVNKNHIGFYPTPSAIVRFNKELAAYQTSKGAIQFPLDKKIPATLVKNIVKFRVKENLEKSVKKNKK